LKVIEIYRLIQLFLDLNNVLNIPKFSRKI